MKKTFIIFFLLLFTCQKPTGSFPSEVVNGEFNENWTSGWQKRIKNYAGDYEIKRMRKGEDFYVRVYKNLCGSAEIFQIVKLTDLASTLSFQAKFSANSNAEEYAAASGIIIEYLNSKKKRLGATYFYFSTPNFSEWQNSSTSHLYKVSSPYWQKFSLNIKKELEKNLLGIDKKEVKYIKISLLAYCTQEGGC